MASRDGLGSGEQCPGVARARRTATAADEGVRRRSESDSNPLEEGDGPAAMLSGVANAAGGEGGQERGAGADAPPRCTTLAAGSKTSS